MYLWYLLFRQNYHIINRMLSYNIIISSVLTVEVANAL